MGKKKNNKVETPIETKVEVETPIETKVETKVEINDGIRLTEVHHLSIKLSQSQYDNLQKDIQNKVIQISLNEREKTILNMQLSDARNRLSRQAQICKDLVKDISLKTGIKLTGASINPDTGEVTMN